MTWNIDWQGKIFTGNHCVFTMKKKGFPVKIFQKKTLIQKNWMIWVHPMCVAKLHFSVSPRVIAKNHERKGHQLGNPVLFGGNIPTGGSAKSLMI